MSETAKSFVRECLTIDPTSRPTAAEALQHKWLASEQPYFVPDPESPSGRPTNLLPHIQKAFDAKKTFRKAVFSMIATKRLTLLAGLSPTAQALSEHIAQFKEESEKEQVDEVRAHSYASVLFLGEERLTRGAHAGPQRDALRRARARPRVARGAEKAGRRLAVRGGGPHGAREQDGQLVRMSSLFFFSLCLVWGLPLRVRRADV